MTKKILVVDDEPDMTRMIKRVLDAAGKYDVRTENLARRAIDVAREFRPDLILLDIMMPGMLGSEIGEQIQADPELHATRFLFLTALVTKSEELSAAGRIGGHTFVSKPISADDLCRVVENHLQH